MNSQQLFATMLLAMCDEDLWRISVDNQIDVTPEVIDWFEDERNEYTEELISYIDDVEFWRHGGN